MYLHIALVITIRQVHRSTPGVACHPRCLPQPCVFSALKGCVTPQWLARKHEQRQTELKRLAAIFTRLEYFKTVFLEKISCSYLERRCFPCGWLP